MIQKKYKALLISLFIFPSFAIKAQLSEEMDIFLQSCNLLNQGIQQKEEALLSDAAEGFGDIGVIELEESGYNISPQSVKFVMLPSVQYNDEFCDELRKTQFEIIERAPLAVNRAIQSYEPINTVSRSIAPNSSVSLSMEGSGDMEISLPSNYPEILTFDVTCDDKSITVEKDLKSGFPYAKWEMGMNPEPFTVTITNPSNERVSFAIAVK